VLTLSIADNLVLDQLDSPQYKSWSGRKLKAIQENGKKRIAEYDIRAKVRTSHSAPSRAGTNKRS